MPLPFFRTEVQERWSRWDNANRQRATDYWRSISVQDPSFERVFMTIELVFGGDQSILLARNAISTTSSFDGRVFNYAPGIIEEPAIESSISMRQQTAAPRSITFRVPAFLIDINAALLNGRMIAGYGEVSLQIDGGDYDKRWVLMRGDMSGGIAFGSDEDGGEIIEFEISDPRDTISKFVPDIAIDTDRWPNAQESVIGNRYPFVLNGYDKVPALRVLDDHGGTGLYFLVCSPGLDFDLGTVYVNGVAKAAGDATYAWSQLQTVDGKGQPCLVIDFSASVGPWNDNDAVHASLNPKSTTPIRTIPQIIKELLAKYTITGPLGISLASFDEVDARMDACLADVIFNSSGEATTDVLRAIESGLLTSFPMLTMFFDGPFLGLAIYERRIGPAREGIVGVLQGGKFPLLERTVLMQETPKSDLFNSFEVRYAYDVINNGFQKIAQRNPDNSPGCGLSYDMVGGLRPKESLETVYLQNVKDANYLIDWMVAHESLPSYYVEWRCLPWVHHRYRQGQNVEYTDDKFSAFTAVTATIERLVYARGDHRIGLRIWHPAWKLGLAQ